LAKTSWSVPMITLPMNQAFHSRQPLFARPQPVLMLITPVSETFALNMRQTMTNTSPLDTYRNAHQTSPTRRGCGPESTSSIVIAARVGAGSQKPRVQSDRCADQHHCEISAGTGECLAGVGAVPGPGYFRSFLNYAVDENDKQNRKDGVHSHKIPGE
jgi:hypothetical protein